MDAKSPIEFNKRINPKYYNWLLYSVAGSFLLFGGFIYAKGGTISLTTVLLVYWATGFINVVFWSAVASAIARILKKNWKNAFLGTSAIMLFIQACITIAAISK